MKFVYRVYPVLLWCLCLFLLGIGCCVSIFMIRVLWTVFLWPLPSAVLAWVLIGFVVERLPRIRYVNEAEIDGFGYVHQPLDVIFPFLLVNLVLAGVMLFRQL